MNSHARSLSLLSVKPALVVTISRKFPNWKRKATSGDPAIIFYSAFYDGCWDLVLKQFMTATRKNFSGFVAYRTLGVAKGGNEILLLCLSFIQYYGNSFFDTVMIKKYYERLVDRKFLSEYLWKRYSFSKMVPQRALHKKSFVGTEISLCGFTQNFFRFE